METIDLKPEEQLIKEVREYFPHPVLRKYQGDLANQIYKLLNNNVKDIVVEAPTGLGKA